MMHQSFEVEQEQRRTTLFVQNKLFVKELSHITNDLRYANKMLHKCKENRAVLYARRHAIVKTTWQEYLEFLEINLKVALEPDFWISQYQQ